MSERSGEDAWIESMARQFHAGSDVLLGIGHDAAAVRLGSEGIAVVAKDVLVDGVHFRLRACGPEVAARKSLAVNLSDLAAAAAQPSGFLVGVVLPSPPERALFDALARGFAAAAVEFGCSCLGGDTNVAAGPLTLSVTVLGRPGPLGVVSRAGARPADILSVTGPLGGSRAGRHLRVQPRVAEAQVLAELGIPHAMIDLSDGLARDLPRLCRASGVGARVQPSDVPVHADVDGGEAPAVRIHHALCDGEDFELLVAHAPLDGSTARALVARGVRLHPIGLVTSEGEGLRLGADAFPSGGWDHVEP